MDYAEAIEHYDALDWLTWCEVARSAPMNCSTPPWRGWKPQNYDVNAVVMKLYDYGRQAIAAGLPDGPLSGVPFLVKDLSATWAGGADHARLQVFRRRRAARGQRTGQTSQARRTGHLYSWQDQHL